MYKFVENTKNAKRHWLEDIVLLRNYYVSMVIETKNTLKLIRKNNVHELIYSTQQSLDNTRNVVSYLNYILDKYRVDLNDGDKKPQQVKKFNKLNYEKVNNVNLKKIILYINELKEIYTDGK